MPANVVIQVLGYFKIQNHRSILASQMSRRILVRYRGAILRGCVNFSCPGGSRLTLRDDRTVHLLHTENPDRCLFARDAVVACLLDQGGFIMCCPLLLVVLEERHSEAAELEDKCDDHEDETEDQREAQLVGGVL